MWSSRSDRASAARQSERFRCANICPAMTAPPILRHRRQQCWAGALALVRSAIGPAAQLIYYEGSERFDVLPLLVATDGAIDAFGHDGRRLRPNIVVGGVEGLAERSWPGKCLRIGNVLI